MPQSVSHLSQFGLCEYYRNRRSPRGASFGERRRISAEVFGRKAGNPNIDMDQTLCEYADGNKSMERWPRRGYL